MATLRLTEPQYERLRVHLYGKPGEHFAFMLADWTLSRSEPVFSVRDFLLVPYTRAYPDVDGWELDPRTVIDAINAAHKNGRALIEAHNHTGFSPRFSWTDRAGLKDFVPYVLDSLPGRPYGATVWGHDSIYGEFFLPGGGTGAFSSITVLGSRLAQLVSRDDDAVDPDVRFHRQLPWFTVAGQRALGRVRVGMVGVGGTGSPALQCLTYLGFRDFVLIDDDVADETNLNRLVTATPADIGTPKVILGRRMVKSVAPTSSVLALDINLQSIKALDALKGVDVLVGCLDNDGARLILNELALAYEIPYFDIGVGIDAAQGRLAAAGGRLAVVLPGGPCLHCMNELDLEEAAYYLSSSDEQEFHRRQGYVVGLDVKAPSVVSLNSLVAALACNELALYLTTGRPVQPYTEFDLLGQGRAHKSQWTTPRRVSPVPGCVQCASAGTGDRARLERYIRNRERAGVAASAAT